MYGCVWYNPIPQTLWFIPHGMQIGYKVWGDNVQEILNSTVPQIRTCETPVRKCVLDLSKEM